MGGKVSKGKNKLAPSKSDAPNEGGGRAGSKQGIPGPPPKPGENFEDAVIRDRKAKDHAAAASSRSEAGSGVHKKGYQTSVDPQNGVDIDPLTGEKKYRRKSVDAPSTEGGWEARRRKSKERLEHMRGERGGAANQNVNDRHDAAFISEEALRQIKFEWQKRPKDNDSWVAYESKYNDILKNAFIRGYPNVKFSVGSQEYEADFKGWTQTNIRTLAKKKIRQA